MSNTFSEVMGEKMETVLGAMDVDLEGRFAKVRTQETNLGKCWYSKCSHCNLIVIVEFLVMTLG